MTPNRNDSNKPMSLSTIIYRFGIGIGIGVCAFFTGKVSTTQNQSMDVLQRVEEKVDKIGKRMNDVELNLDAHIHSDNRINSSQWRTIEDMKESIPEFRQNQR